MSVNITLRDAFLRPFNSIDRINSYQQQVNNNLENDLNKLNGKKTTILAGTVTTPNQQKEVKSIEAQIKNVRGQALVESLQLSLMSRAVATGGVFGFNANNAFSSFGKIVGETPVAVALTIPQLIDLARKKRIPEQDKNLVKIAVLALKTIAYVLFAVVSPLIGLLSPQGAYKLQSLFRMELNKEDRNALSQLANIERFQRSSITDQFNGNSLKRIRSCEELIESIRSAKNHSEAKPHLKSLETKFSLISTAQSTAINNVNRVKEYASASVVRKAEDVLNHVQTAKSIFANHVIEARHLVAAKPVK